MHLLFIIDTQGKKNLWAVFGLHKPNLTLPEPGQSQCRHPVGEALDLRSPPFLPNRDVLHCPGFSAACPSRSSLQPCRGPRSQRFELESIVPAALEPIYQGKWQVAVLLQRSDLNLLLQALGEQRSMNNSPAALLKAVALGGLTCCCC